MAVVLLASTFWAVGSSHGATTVATTGQPVYQFVDTGTEPLPWNAVSLQSQLNSTTMLGGPHGATSATEGVLAYRTNLNQLALFTQNGSGGTSWINYTLQNNVPTPADDPVPFFDPSGNVDVLYVDTSGDVELLSANDAVTTTWARLHHDTPWRPYVTTNLSALTGVDAAVGLPSVQVNGAIATVAYRTASNAVEVLTLSWSPDQPIPVYAQNDATVTNDSSTPFTSDPVVLPGADPAFATSGNGGHVLVYASVDGTLDSWSDQDLTALAASAPVAGALAVGENASSLDLAALSSTGGVELFSSPYSTFSPSPFGWIEQNVTTLASGAPPLSGTLSVQVTPTQVAVAGQAANWGDLFVLTSAVGTAPWTATDVSVTAGSVARTVGKVIAGLQINGQLTLYAAGVSSPPPQGVGVYAIPSAKWTKAVGDGWPIISETGGLGTRSAPWVGFTSTANVADSPDFLMGQAIYNAHKRVTWLSFWTVSGPLAGQSQSTTNYYNHGFAAGVWVATQIDSYRALGVGLKPDWVILDPEGYPDNHSHLDAPGGSSVATLAKYATYWSSMLSGWQAGVASIDPSLNAAVYASQSEYRNYALTNLSMPVFMAIAFGGGGPTPITGASGSNVRGFISFGAVCTPAAKLQAEAATLLNPPWGGQFNTLQFNAGVYCAPPSS